MVGSVDGVMVEGPGVEGRRKGGRGVLVCPEECLCREPGSRVSNKIKQQVEMDVLDNVDDDD